MNAALSQLQISYLEDGKMKGCLGRACPSSCCRPKRKRQADGGHFHYNTSISPGEYAHQRDLDATDPALEALGIEIFPVSDYRGQLGYYIEGCLDPESGCKLGPIGRKPEMCKVFPAAKNVGGELCPEQDAIIAQMSAETLARFQEVFTGFQF